jgi:ABC-type transport system involved in multi-copper enzyme maturation permease subunit
MRAVLTIAHLTLAEASRRRIVTAALLCAVAVLAVFTTAVFFAAREDAQRVTFIERQALFMFLTLAGLYMANFLSVLFAVLLPVDTLSGEIDSGIMQTVAVKPVHRSDIVLGKWLGNGLIVGAYLLVLVAGVLTSVRFIAGFSPVNLTRALPLMLLEVTVLMTVSIAGGTRFSTVTNGIVGLGFYGIAFIGGWVEQVGALARFESVRNIGVAASLISPPDSMWRLAVYYLQPPLLRSAGQSPFASIGPVPTPLMIWWAAAFVVLTLLYAIRTFSKREL